MHSNKMVFTLLIVTLTTSVWAGSTTTGETSNTVTIQEKQVVVAENPSAEPQATVRVEDIDQPVFE
ncbi:hypothetical protein [Acinetobacter sp. ANC 3832]|uniref:hypothetical protein n=1 Tax=Acinetobacter sp. ANC 3832 TaxID=1977874 RepID=UPI000A33C5CD|nr:hypothetical protein [Acinetobacter sp. ANC 3832]OTG95777.1 hypothetical protein B9T35_04360 [Acinetobacter sp. ANC 3832]